MSTKTQERVALVLKRIADSCAADKESASMYAHMLEHLLNGVNGDDAFGTEGATDPRGDYRDGDWSMGRVQGIDA